MLVAVDFDGVLSADEMTILLGEAVDRAVAEEMTGIVEDAATGDVDRARGLRHRARLLEGLPEDRAAAAYERVRLRPGMADLLADLGAAGHEVVVFTDGFEGGVEAALERAGVGVGHVLANRLPLENGAVAGTVEGPLVEEGPAEAVERLAVGLGVDLADVVAVADGVDDLRLLQVAGIAVGFSPTSLADEECDAVVHSVEKLRLVLEQRGLLERPEE